MTPLLLLFSDACRSFERRFDSIAFNCFQNLRSHSAVWSQTSKRNAPVLAVIDLCATAVVAGYIALCTAIGNVQHAPATTTAKQPGKKTPPSASRLWLHARFHVCIIAQHCLIPLELLPRDVSGMVVAKQNHPCLNRFEVSFGLSRAAIDNLGPRFRFAECVSARVHRISHHPPYGVVNRQLPHNLLSWPLIHLWYADLFSAKPQ